MTGAGVFVGIGRGYFRELGLDVRVEPFRSAPDLLPALAADQIDVGASAPNAGLYNALVRDVPIKIIGEQGSSVPGREGYYALVVRKDLWDSGEVRDYSDLRGRTIAVTGVGGGGSFEIAINRVLQRSGLTPQDVNLVNLGFPDLNPALASGGAELALNIEPFLTQGLDQGLFEIWLRPEQIWDGAHMEAVIMASPGLVARPDIASRFMIGYLKGVRAFLDAFWLGRGDKSALITVLAQYTGVADRALWHKLRPPWVDPNGQVDVASLARDMRWNARAGYLHGDVRAEAVVDERFAACAVQELGPYSGS
jgi:NitT/TauT family transport system substrate-binding protein